MDLTQILLIAVVIILTSLLLVVGTQVFLILKDARRAIQKTNKILEDANLVTSSVVKPFASVAGFVESIKGAKRLVGVLSQQKKSQRAKRKNLENSHDAQEILRPRSTYVPKSARVFRRAGRPLSS